jgi:hypothetical protein
LATSASLSGTEVNRELTYRDKFLTFTIAPLLAGILLIASTYQGYVDSNVEKKDSAQRSVKPWKAFMPATDFVSVMQVGQPIGFLCFSIDEFFFYSCVHKKKMFVSDLDTGFGSTMEFY